MIASRQSSFKFLRGNLRLFWSYVKVNWKLFFFGIVLGSALIYLWPSIQLKIRPPRTPIIGVVGNYTVSNPPLIVQKELSYGLTKLLPNGQATSAAATKWEITNEGKTIEFDLNQNLFWQDGTKFDSSQINYNLKGVDIKRLSLYKIQFNFKEPFSPLISIVSQPLFKNGLIGLGDNKVEGIKLNGRFLGSLTLRNQTDGSVKVYKFFPNEKIAISAFQLGTTNQVIGLRQTYGLHTDPQYSAQAVTDKYSLALILLNNHKQPLSEKTFRQALVYALPDHFEEGEEAVSSLPKDNWASSETPKKYSQNQKLALDLISKTASISSKIKLKLSSPSNLSSVANQISQAWNQIGLSTSVTISDFPELSFDAHLTLLDLPVDPDQYYLWHSTQKGNLTGYKSFKVDHLLEDGRKTFDSTKRREIYASLEKALTEDVPAIFLYYPRTYSIIRR